MPVNNNTSVDKKSIIPISKHTKHVHDFIIHNKGTKHPWTGNNAHSLIDIMEASIIFVKKVLWSLLLWLWGYIKWVPKSWAYWLIAMIWYACVVYLIFGSMEAVYMVIHDVLDVVHAVFGDITGGVSSVVGSISSAFGGSSSVSISDPVPTAHALLDGYAWYQTLKNAPHLCDDLNTWGAVLAAILDEFISPIMCPIARFLYPSDIAFTVFYGVFWWTMNDPAPYAYANCADPPDRTMCIYFQLYLVIRIIPNVTFWLFTLSAFSEPLYDVLGVIAHFLRSLRSSLAQVRMLASAGHAVDYDVCGF